MGPLPIASAAGAVAPMPATLRPELVAYHAPVNHVEAAAEAFQRVLEATRAGWPVGHGMGSALGFDAIANFAGELSKSNSKALKGLQDMLQLDLTKPETGPQIVGAMIEMSKMAVQTKFVTSVSSKITDGANRLLNSQ